MEAVLLYISYNHAHLLDRQHSVQNAVLAMVSISPCHSLGYSIKSKQSRITL